MKNLSHNVSRFIPFTCYLPLITFMIAVRSKGLLQASEHSLDWSAPFFYASVAAILVIALHLAYKADLNRFWLALNGWLIASAALFVLNNQHLLNLMDDYKGPFFFAVFIITGVISILFLPGGFIDIKTISHEKNQKLSLLLLAGCAAALVWSLVFNSSGFVLSIVVPFIAVRIWYGMLLVRP